MAKRNTLFNKMVESLADDHGMAHDESIKLAKQALVENRQNKKEQKRVCFLLSVSSGIERWKNTTNYDDQRDRASTRATYAASKAIKP